MRPVGSHLVPTILLFAAPIGAQTIPRIVTAVSRHSTILLVEFEQVEHPQAPHELAATVNVHARISRILKDENHLGLTPTQCDLTIRPSVGFVSVGANYWTRRDIRAGQRYIVFSNVRTDLATIIAETGSGEELIDGVDSVGDIDLILNSESLPFLEQVRRVILTLKDSQRHSFVLAQYTAALLDAGSDAETRPLAAVLEAGGDSAFSEAAQEALLSGLFDHSRSPFARVPPMPLDPPGPASDNVIRVFTSLAVRYFGETPKEPARRATRLQRAILANYLPFLRKSGQAAPVLRQHLSAASKPIRDAAQRCLDDNRLTEGEKNEARELLNLLN